ncbi:molybdenum cofactor biosynthesis protein A [Thermodesulfatator indicus DSM 15286]|uniref:GTP 3',8-cyclase n=1 Tax=Thermodesulfatator indicus (strain DSM 15286 / JCM 11887 / CIR29812) TaxID=667014 RepID=F8A8W9_THEID|nr:GTP 3',8-cyclase MoaA [Thermodesulfatator indicus]AEH44016.1 molybdenum cofactor biosynthesis protein A [Thermodesulfatator indicus DSM 15286]
MLIDSYGRKITYLRVSVTDRCNLRCFYCSSKDSFAKLPPEKILSYEELYQIIKVAVSLGVKRVRLTGGEPLVRKDLVSFVAALAQIPGLEDLALTTNGILFASMALDLKKAGLKRVNISLDAITPQKYKEICGIDALNQVLAGIEKALEVGFSPVKINMVVMRGLNDDEAIEMARLTLKEPLEVRFIEFMPIGSGAPWEEDLFMPVSEIEKRLKEVFGELHPASKIGAGPAKVFTLPGAKGSVGFISAISNHFCHKCNRLRLTPEGRLRLCLFSDEEIDLRPFLNQKNPQEALKEAFLKAIQRKPSQRSLDTSPKRLMRSIGG